MLFPKYEVINIREEGKTFIKVIPVIYFPEWYPQWATHSKFWDWLMSRIPVLFFL